MYRGHCILHFLDISLNMKLTFSTESGDIIREKEVSEEETMYGLISYLSVEFEIEMREIGLLIGSNRGRPPPSMSDRVSSLGVKDGDLILVLRRGGEKKQELGNPARLSSTPSSSGSSHAIGLADIPPNVTPDGLMRLIHEHPHLQPLLEVADPEIGERVPFFCDVVSSLSLSWLLASRTGALTKTGDVGKVRKKFMERMVCFLSYPLSPFSTLPSYPLSLSR